MADIIVLDVAPEAAILNSNDAALPVKRADAGVEQPRFALKFDYIEDNKAFWSWPIPQQSRLGTLLGTGVLRLHWSANSVDTDDVRWGVRVGYVRDGESIDKALGAEVLSTTQAHSGVQNQEEVTEIALSSIFASLAVEKSARLVLQVRRVVGLASNLDATVSLHKSSFALDFVSRLEVVGPVIQSLPVLLGSRLLDPSELGRHIIVDTNAIGGPATVYLPTEASAGPMDAAANDGYSFWISKIGPHQVSILPDPAGSGATTIRGAATPTLLISSGDSARFVYTGYDNAYQVF